MDMTMFDITDFPDGQVKTGDWIELFGPNIALDDAARSGGTVAYEMLTGCGRRAAKRYVESEHRV
jgi:alanine racemase